MMRPSSARPLSVIVDIADHGGRLKNIELRHIYQGDRNTLDVTFDLLPGKEKGFILLLFPFKPDFCSGPWFGRLSVSIDPVFETGRRIDYDEDTTLHYVDAVVVRLPRAELLQLGAISIEIPRLPEGGFAASYTLYPPGDALVSTTGSAGISTPDVVGVRWLDLRQVQSGTTVAISTRHLQKRAQESLAVGTILIALGANLITSYLFSHVI
jgi:hypothetical protein